MNRRVLLAGGALLAVAAALAVAVVLQLGSLVVWTGVAVAVVAGAAGAAALYAGLQRWYLLVRYLATRPIGVAAASRLEPGTRWVRIAGDVAAAGDVETVLSGGTVAARTLRLERRTHPSGLDWPGIDRRSLADETELGSFALVEDTDRVRFESEATVRMAAPAAHESYGPGDEPSFVLIQALQRAGQDFETVVGDGALGQHRLHVREATVESGDAVQLFGLLTVEGDGVRTLRPAVDRGGEAAVARGHRLAVAYLRGGLAGLLGAGVLGYLGWFVLSLVVL